MLILPIEYQWGHLIYLLNGEPGVLSLYNICGDERGVFSTLRSDIVVYLRSWQLLAECPTNTLILKSVKGNSVPVIDCDNNSMVFGASPGWPGSSTHPTWAAYLSRTKSRYCHFDAGHQITVTNTEFTRPLEYYAKIQKLCHRWLSLSENSDNRSHKSTH